MLGWGFVVVAQKGCAFILIQLLKVFRTNVIKINIVAENEFKYEQKNRQQWVEGSIDRSIDRYEKNSTMINKLTS